ncbi:tRNA pseudouridine synthase A [Candidatus Xenohaliotis californiensis]|uniref:tRNA pseudouridine synthase A n=1 Tax=Candidatus Xenohaliotis californiensis TaxID=84677 RepID=A0ABP0ESK0_9RICK|nr:tRNA pseudouridine synthase A [Candidatus Xenohaliotis californiensis]
MRYKLTVEYNGSGFHGWQQQQGLLSVQSVIESALQYFLQEMVTVYCAGRTDAGVNAVAQVVHFDINRELSPIIIMNALNFYLRTKLVSIVNAELVPDSFHARFSAKKRHYKYCIFNRRVPAVFEKSRRWQVYKALNVIEMSRGAKFFMGRHDFNAFRSSECQAYNSIRTIDDIEIVKDGYYIDIMLSARSFLHKQVRIMVGTLCAVGLGAMKPEQIMQIIASKDRKRAGATAPAYALYFMGVDY